MLFSSHLSIKARLTSETFEDFTAQLMTLKFSMILQKHIVALTFVSTADLKMSNNIFNKNSLYIILINFSSAITMMYFSIINKYCLITSSALIDCAASLMRILFVKRNSLTAVFTIVIS